MMDEYHDRLHQSGRAQINAGLDRAFAALICKARITFRTFQAIQFASPWTKRKDVGCA